MRLPRTSGVLLHPTSLPGPHGSGDFGPAAHHFVDWLVAAGQKRWQILPLGGIGPGNSPYMSNSAFAGNVLLIDLAALQQQGWLDAQDLAPDPQFQAQKLNFAAVVPWRMARLARAQQRFAAAGAPAEQAAFADFCERQRAWLDDYALFMALAEHHGWQDWCDWPAELVKREAQALRAAAAQHRERIDFHRFGQWQFFEQWQRLRGYAHQRGVSIIGDAPIFIAYQSAEVWARQDLFELDARGRAPVVAGVPPDYFSASGQRWGNPLYRWARHKEEGYAWWTERLRHTFSLVDVVRIDHFRGFVDYWEIPASEPTAIKGRWRDGPGAALFDAASAALGPMPIIAEDLGLLTPEVEVLRKRLALPGMRILHFAFADDSRNHYLPHWYEADSVVYTGTHDNDTTLGWWATASEHERGHTLAYLDSDGREIHWDLMRAALASVADTAVIPMQDVLGLSGEHRMNKPGQPDGYWTWRFDWSQVTPEHAHRLAALCRLYSR